MTVVKLRRKGNDRRYETISASDNDIQVNGETRREGEQIGRRVQLVEVTRHLNAVVMMVTTLIETHLADHDADLSISAEMTVIAEETIRARVRTKAVEAMVIVKVHGAKEVRING